ncbi:MAG: ABC transporter permease [Candidatus Omnitrophota bacterium]|nr:ABC transporter permease [Candidatus Omnitrophota bacterium]MDZ4242134.1 ABC transporter permease [Candidatus Omnitrophota bacterium]
MSQSEFQIHLRQFRKNRLAVVCAWVLAALYAVALFADFLAPYTYRDEDRKYSYCPPTAVRVWDEGRLSMPFVYGINLTFNDLHARVYVQDNAQKYPVRLFARGEEYKWLGVIPSRTHLFGVDAPGRIYLLGADARGRDVFSRLMYGARISLSIGLIGVLISFTIGLIVGGIAGYYGGWVDNALMRICEMFMMVPGFYLLLALRAAVPENFNSVQIYFAIVIILSFISWASLARIIRGMCLSLREREYVLAAKAIGLSDMAVIIRHILPHTVSYSIVAVMLSIPGYILGESALSLIGLGIQDPFASWGNMLTDAMSIVRIQFAPWILWPAFFIFLTIVSFNIVGDALRDCLDPLLKTGREG